MGLEKTGKNTRKNNIVGGKGDMVGYLLISINPGRKAGTDPDSRSVSVTKNLGSALGFSPGQFY